jgi:hypothetical protein
VVVVFGGELVVGLVVVLVESSIDTLPRFSPQAETPVEAPAPRAAAITRIPAFRSTRVRVA